RGGVAPDSRRLLLVPRRSGRAQKRCQQFRRGHGLRIEPGSPRLAADDLPDSQLVGLAPRAGREPLRVAERAHSPPPPTPPPAAARGSFCMDEMTTTAIDIALLTPLAASLRLRETGRASFLLESVDQGRLGRYSLVGCGDRLVSFEEAERLGEAVVGYLGYDHIAKLERTVPLPSAGPDVPESRFVVADVFL